MTHPTKENNSEATNPKDEYVGRRIPSKDFTYHDYSQVPSPKPNTASTFEGQGSKEPTFAMKLHMILSNPEFHEIITWLPHGRSWRILQQKRFEERVIPLYFRHGRYSSFARQVNGWGFRRIIHGSDYNSYYHELFLRGKSFLCDKMKRLTPKDLAERKKEIDGPAPDFYAISRDNPLPEATYTTTMTSTEPVMSLSCLESKEILDRINLLAGSKNKKSKTLTGKNDVTPARKMSRTVDSTGGERTSALATPDHAMSSSNADLGANPCGTGRDKRVGDRATLRSSERPSASRGERAANESFQSLAVGATSPNGSSTTASTVTTPGASKLIPLVATSSMRTVVAKPTSASENPTHGSAPGTSASLNHQPSKPAATKSTDASTLGVSHRYANNVGRQDESHSMTRQSTVPGTSSTISVQQTTKTSISLAQSSAIGTSLPPQTTTNGKPQTASLVSPQPFSIPIPDEAVGTTASNVNTTIGISTSATNGGSVSVSPVTKPALGTATASSRKSTGCLSASGVQTNTAVSFLPPLHNTTIVGSPGHQVRLGVSNSIYTSTSAVVPTTSSLDRSSVSHDTSLAQPESTATSPTRSAAVTTDTTALAANSGPTINNTTVAVPNNTSNSPGTPLSATRNGTPLPTVPLPGQTTNLGTENFLHNGALGAPVLSQPMTALCTATIPPGAPIGPTSHGQNTTITTTGASLGAPSFASPTALAPASLSQTPTLAQPAQFGAATISPNAAYGTMIPASSPFGTATIAPAISLRTAPFSPAITFGASPFPPTVTFLTPVGAAQFAQAATLGATPFGALNPTTSLSAIPIHPGAALSAAALSPVTAFNSASLAPAVNIGTMNFAPATSVRPTSLGPASTSIGAASFGQGGTNGTTSFPSNADGATAGRSSVSTPGSVDNSSASVLVDPSTAAQPTNTPVLNSLSQFPTNTSATV